LKRKFTYSFLTLFILVGLYFGLRLFFGFFTPYNSLTARQDIKKGKIQIIAVGLPYMPQIEQKVADKYGFNFNYVGCNATTELLNGTEYYNNIVENHLENKYGKNFWKKFQSQVDSLIKIETKND
jgi:hypothetical protein